MRLIRWIRATGWVLALGVGGQVCVQAQAPGVTLKSTGTPKAATKTTASPAPASTVTSPAAAVDPKATSTPKTTTPGPAATPAGTEKSTVPTAAADAAAIREGMKEAKSLEKKLPKPKAATKPNFDLSAAKQERLKKFLPKSWETLSQRETYHIVALGDSVFDLWKDDGGDAPPAFPAAFAQELAAVFFYTGGVYEIGAKGSEQRSMGPAIGVRQLSRPSGCVLDAPRVLATSARQTKVDLVLLCYGQGEAAAGMSPVTFTHAVQDAVDDAKEIGADVILCGPWLEVADHAETRLGMARPLSDALREVAQQEGVLFADLGDLARMAVPEPTKADEGRVYDAIERTYKGFFHAENGRYIPRAAMHGQLGSLIFRTLMDGSPAMPWTIAAATAIQQESDHLTMNFLLSNSTAKPMDATVLPLIASGWKPMATTPLMTLPAAGKQAVKVEYSRISPDAAPVQEPLVRLPVLISAGAKARVEDLRASVQPLAIVWGMETLFNQESSFSVSCQLVNSSGKNVKGSWQADLGGKRLEGNYDVKPNAVLPLDLHFNLPTDGPATRVLPLLLTVKADGGIHLRAHRQVEIIRNLGLGQDIGLRPLDGSRTGAAEVTLHAAATEKDLTLVCALTKAELLNDAPAEGSPAWQLEVNLDARSYGKRLERGSTATLQATGSAGDGPGIVHEVAPWCFGDGYAAMFEPKAFKAALSTSPEGKRQITLTIPRTYLYLHEWALNNGNSQLGINVRLTIRHAPIGAPPGLTTYALTVNANSPEDVESLAVLELAAEPTKRMTVSVY